MKELAQLLFLCSLLVIGQGTTIFIADFSSTAAINSQWTITSNYVDSSSNTMRLRATGSAQRIVDTTGFSSIFINFAAEGQSLESGEYCAADYSTDGGATWTTTTTVANGQDVLGTWYPFAIQTTSNAGQNSQFMVRFRIAGSTTGDYCYVANMNVTGTVSSPPPPSPTPTPTPYSCDYDCLSGNGAVTRTSLTYAQLTGSSVPASPFDTSAFQVPLAAANPTNFFEGYFTLSAGTSTTAKWTEVRDDYNYVSAANPTAGYLPSDSIYTFVQYGTHIIPTVRTNQRSSHPYWEMVLSPGRVWNENSDNGYTRAAFPFSLTQRNANCVLNGMMMFLFKNSGPQFISQVYYQVTQETCLYFKINMWGLLTPSLTFQGIQNAATYQSNFATERTNYMSTQPFSALATKFPGINMTAFGAGVTPAHMTVYGVIVDGVHYRSDAQNSGRYGPYPFPEYAVLPSYSTGKLLGVSAQTMRIDQKHPTYNGGTGVYYTPLSPLIPSCTRYAGVQINHALNMGTGWYDSTGYMADEDSTKTTNNFFLPETASAKISFACTQYGGRNNAGVNSTWVYHTSDFYMVSTALTQVLSTAEPATGGLKNFWNNEFVSPLLLSDICGDVRTTYDATAQPWFGWGMFYYPDDVAKLANFFNAGEGKLNGNQLLSYSWLKKALQRSPGDGFLVPNPPAADNPDGWNYRYRSGAWAIDLYRQTTINQQCGLLYCPFVIGYGGIEIIFLPNKMIYYYFSDNEEFSWASAALALSNARSPCSVSYSP